MLFLHTTFLTALHFFFVPFPAGTRTFSVTDSTHWVSVALFLRTGQHGLESDNVPDLLPGLRICGAIPPLPRMSSTGPLPCHFYAHTEQSN